jgi:hypothetical protein
MTSLFALLGIFFAVIVWRSGRRAAEAANRACRLICQQQNVQFLDHTVVFRRFEWKGGVLRRVFNFDYCPDGQERFRGMIWMRNDAFDYAALDQSGSRVILTLDSLSKESP